MIVYRKQICCFFNIAAIRQHKRWHELFTRQIASTWRESTMLTGPLNAFERLREFGMRALVYKGHSINQLTSHFVIPICLSQCESGKHPFNDQFPSSILCGLDATPRSDNYLAFVGANSQELAWRDKIN